MKRYKTKYKRRSRKNNSITTLLLLLSACVYFFKNKEVDPIYSNKIKSEIEPFKVPTKPTKVTPTTSVIKTTIVNEPTYVTGGHKPIPTYQNDFISTIDDEKIERQTDLNPLLTDVTSLGHGIPKNDFLKSKTV